MTTRILTGDCRDVLATLPAESVDAVVTDPPYDLTAKKKGGSGVASVNLASPYGRARIGTGNGAGGFMGMAWDSTGVGFDPATWEAVSRVMKPGAHLLAFGGDRTIHRMTCAIEDAGFEIRTQLVWLHGQGFPKNLNVSRGLESLLPEDIRCACDHHSTRTDQDSPDDYPGRPHSGDAQPRTDQDSGLSALPSPGDARGHTHAGQHADDPASLQASISPDAGIGHCANGYSPGHALLQLEDSRSNGSTWSDTAASTSRASQTEPHRTALRRPDMSHSDGDSAASSSFPSRSGYSHLPHCSTCGGVIVPEGLGTALKPAMELIILARKPLGERTVAANVLAHGTGALNIDGCRVEISPDDFDGRMVNATKPSTFDATQHTRCGVSNHNPAGRWPPNVLLSPDAAALLDAMSGERKTSQPGAVRRTKRTETTAAMQGGLGVMDRSEPAYGDTGGASRFFPVLPIDDPDTLRFAYRPKASRAERNRGLDGMPECTYGLHDDDAYRQPGERKANHTAPQPAANHHPTVKPLALMQWLVRLVTPPGGTVLDPFLGSGTTLVAAGREGFDGIGIELEPDYVAIAQRRIAADAPLFMEVAP